MTYKDIEGRIILNAQVGSKLYGTNTPQSDTDYVGIFIAPEEYYFGLKNVDEVDFSIESKNENGRNNSNAIDSKYYEIKKFFKLAIDNNPNIIELLFLNKENILTNSETFNLIQENRKYFLSSEMVMKKFLAYAFSQKKKMFIKTDHYTEILKAYEEIEKYDDKTLLVEIPLFKDFKTYDITTGIGRTHKEIKIGDISLPTNIYVKRAKQILGSKITRVGSRKELVIRDGYDSKFGSHLLRLTLEAEELLLTGKLTFPLVYADKIKDVKLGNVALEKLINDVEEIEDRLNKFDLKTSPLPLKADFNKINELLINITKNSF